MAPKISTKFFPKNFGELCDIVKLLLIIDKINITQNHYVLKKNYMSFRVLNSKFVCRRCLNSCTSQNVLNKHIHRFNQKEITSIRTWHESHLF